jgi:hypothetical protein
MSITLGWELDSLRFTCKFNPLANSNKPARDWPARPDNSDLPEILAAAVASQLHSFLRVRVYLPPNPELGTDLS